VRRVDLILAFILQNWHKRRKISLGFDSTPCNEGEKIQKKFRMAAFFP